MKKGFLSEYFVGVTAKRLSTVETHPESSNQHEFNGVKELEELLGGERLTDAPTRFVWLGEENEGFPKIHLSRGMTHVNCIPPAVSTGCISKAIL